VWSFLSVLSLVQVWLVSLAAAPAIVAPTQPLTVPETDTPEKIAPSASPQLSNLSLSPQLDQQLQRYRQFLAQGGPPDILIVGSSRALQGIDPIALQQALVHQGLPHLRVFNLGLNGATAQVVDLILRQLLLPDQLPRMIIWGDGSRAFNSGRTDQTYRKLVASPGYQRLVARQPLPTALSSSLGSRGLCLEVPRNPVAQKTLPAKRSHPSPLPPSTLIPELLNFRRLCVPQMRSLLVPEAAAAPEAKAGDRKVSLGFNPVASRFDPNTYYDRFPRVAGKYDGDYRNFQLEGEQRRALHRIFKFTQTHQIPVVFVNLPLSQPYVDPWRTKYEQQFRTHVQSLVTSGDWLVFDLSQHWPTRYDYFSDPSHLNLHGARVVAVEVARNLAILLEPRK
jgi:hypothetical protein